MPWPAAASSATAAPEPAEREAPIRDLAVSPDSSTVVTVGWWGSLLDWPAGFVDRWPLGRGAPAYRQRLSAEAEPLLPEQVTFSPDGQTVAAAGRDGVIAIWPSTGTGHAGVAVARAPGVRALAFRDNSHLVWGGVEVGLARPAAARCRDRRTTSSGPRPAGSGAELAMLDDGVLATGASAPIPLPARSARVLPALPDGAFPRRIAATADGRRVAATDDRGRLFLWPADVPARVSPPVRLPGVGFLSVATDRGGTVLVAATTAGRCTSGAPVLAGHRAPSRFFNARATAGHCRSGRTVASP